DSGLVQPVRTGVGSVNYAGYELLFVSTGLGTKKRQAGDLQLRPGRAIHQRGFHGATPARRNSNQHGWAGPSAGQCVRGTVVADGEMGRDLLEGLQRRARRGREPWNVLSVLQFRTSPSVSGQPDTCGGLLRHTEKDAAISKTGHAPGQSSRRSSFVDD